MNILITGGAGFIGSAVIRYILKHTDYNVLNIDDLTYAGNLRTTNDFTKNKNYQFKKVNICNFEALKKVFYEFEPNIVMHLAAESHVDRSINDPKVFIDTNIYGTFNLLEVSKNYLDISSMDLKKNFKFHHISTDEVYGSLKLHEEPFVENDIYDPSSPYSASKASSDHLVNAWNKTYNLPVVITNCSNNYGPFHYPEKLIPSTIIKAILRKKIVVYGDGMQIRDWLYVDDHAEALLKVAEYGQIGEKYNIGGSCEKTNIEVVNTICNILSKKYPLKNESISSYNDLITFTSDRPGHDFRYAINSTKIKEEFDWSPRESFETGIEKTINWYLENKDWWIHLIK